MRCRSAASMSLVIRFARHRLELRVRSDRYLTAGGIDLEWLTGRIEGNTRENAPPDQQLPAVSLAGRRRVLIDEWLELIDAVERIQLPQAAGSGAPQPLLIGLQQIAPQES